MYPIMNLQNQTTKKSLIVTFWFLVTFVFSTFGQEPITGFTDKFNRSSLDTTWEGSTYNIWQTSSPETYQLGIENDAMLIDYTRESESSENANFNFDPPHEIDTSEWPRITFDLKSDIETTLTLRKRYTIFNSIDQEKEIPGDDSWHSYTFFLDESQASEETIERIFLYFDRGTTSSKKGSVQINNFKVAGYGIDIFDFTAQTMDKNSIKLTWEADDPEGVQSYEIYRSTEVGVPVDSKHLVVETEEQQSLDKGLQNWSVYYYRVAVTDTNDHQHISKEEIRQETYPKDQYPEITVTDVNRNVVPEYDKFEIHFDLDKVIYQNPFNPEQIDTYAKFTSPSGETKRINGFYDNHQNSDEWKLRFAPDEVGEWEYRLFAENADRKGQSESHSFTVTESAHHGPLQVSSGNSNYLMHHDSTSFFGNAVYYPWNVSLSGLEHLKQAGGNLFGYWNSTYDNAGNGGGAYLLESMDSGLGRYDQRMAGRLDQILSWAEELDLKMMYAIWAHDWLRIRGQPWDVSHSEWYSNPYSEEFDPVEFYTQPEALDLQKNSTDTLLPAGVTAVLLESGNL